MLGKILRKKHWLLTAPRATLLVALTVALWILAPAGKAAALAPVWSTGCKAAW